MPLYTNASVNDSYVGRIAVCNRGRLGLIDRWVRRGNGAEFRGIDVRGDAWSSVVPLILAEHDEKLVRDLFPSIG